MTWLKLEELRTLWEVAESLADFSYDSATAEEIVEHFLNRLCARPVLAAYAYEKGKVTIRDVVEEKLKIQIPSKMKREINLWCERRARESAEKTLQYPKVRKPANRKLKITSTINYFQASRSGLGKRREETVDSPLEHRQTQAKGIGNSLYGMFRHRSTNG